MTNKTERSWRPSRPAAYREIFKQRWERLKMTDFSGEAVAIRDDSGRPTIHRRSRSAIRDMAKQSARREMRELAARGRAQG